MTKSLGETLHNIRKDKNLSIYDVEKATGIHYSTISRYERDQREPKLQILKELAEYYEVPLAQLVTPADDLVRYLPEELAQVAKILIDREDLLDLVKTLQRLQSDDIQKLTDFCNGLLKTKCDK